jgi:putative oxidoreductase
MFDLGLLLVRLVFGLIMAAHGTQKVFGWFGGYGLDGTGGFMESLGFRPGRFFAAAAGWSEILSGLLFALGFLGPLGPALMISVMIVAGVTAHSGKGVFAQNGGYEVPLLYAVGAAAVALTGYGAISLDAAIGLPFAWSPFVTISVLVAGVLGAFANLALRRRTVTA